MSAGATAAGRGRHPLLVLVVLGALSVAPGRAQDFPTKPIELVIPYGSGGSHDLTARALASVAQQYLGQPLLVVLKPGGGGAVGFQYVARAKPDGYTLMLGGSGPKHDLRAGAEGSDGARSVRAGVPDQLLQLTAATSEPHRGGHA